MPGYNDDNQGADDGLGALNPAVIEGEVIATGAVERQEEGFIAAELAEKAQEAADLLAMLSTPPAEAFYTEFQIMSTYSNKQTELGGTLQEAIDAHLSDPGTYGKEFLQILGYVGTGWSSTALIASIYPNSPYDGRTVSNRNYYSGGTPASGGGSGVATPPLPVDFLGSPWIMPDVLREQFKLEPVLRAGFLPSVRPGDVGGIVHHPNRRSTLRVMNQDGTCVYATTNFMLEGVQRLVEEDYRPAQGFEENLIQLYGEKFKIYSFSMKMINSANLDWQRAWDQAWRKHIRGSVLAAKHNRCYILSGTKIYGGYPVKYTDQTSAALEPVGKMNMVMFVTDDEPLPTMIRLKNKAGQEYFKWVPKSGESIFSSESMHFAKDMPEYADEVITATSFDETEIESPSGIPEPAGPPA